MSTITFDFKFKKSTASQVLSASELKDTFLYGIIDLIKSNGREIPDTLIDYWIQDATVQIEKLCSIKIKPQIIRENKDFHYDDWTFWSQVKTTYPVVIPIKMEGFVNTVRQVSYPRNWITSRKTSDGVLYSRLIHVIPNYSGALYQNTGSFVGIYPNLGMIAPGRHTPEYWSLEYLTGFTDVPVDIITAIGQLATLNILTIANQTVAANMGTLGIGSKSISIDGLSQSTSSYANGQVGIFGSTIKQYSTNLFGQKGDMSDGLLKRLQEYYEGILFTTC